MNNPIPKNGIQKPSEFMKEKQAIENAKDTSGAPKPPVDANAPKAEDKPVEGKSEASKKTKNKTSEEWEVILDEIEAGVVTIPEAAKKFNVSTSNIYQHRTKRKQKRAKDEVASLSSNTIVEDAKKLISTVDKELEEFDKGIEEAKAKVANAKEERAKIEAKTKKYQTIIDLFEEEDKKDGKNDKDKK